MAKTKVRIKDGMTHAIMFYVTDENGRVHTEIEEHGEGEILEVTERELDAFGDKFVVVAGK